MIKKHLILLKNFLHTGKNRGNTKKRMQNILIRVCSQISENTKLNNKIFLNLFIIDVTLVNFV